MSSSKQLSAFSFQDNSIRVTGTPEAPLFVLSDVCKVLALQNINHTVKQIQEEFEGVTLNVTPLQTAGGVQNVLVITEPQLYFVMMRSRAKLAKAFRQWIVNEVLPAIRKTGSYTQQENKKTSSYIQIFNQFCAEHRYSNEERAMFSWFKDQAVKQGYAIACSQLKERLKQDEDRVLLKEDEVAIPKEIAKKIYQFFDYFSKHKKEMMRTALEMREQSKILMRTAEDYEATKIMIKQAIFNKL